MHFGIYNFALSSITILIALYAKKYEEIDRESAFPKNPSDLLVHQAKEYDFIIVGAGSSGSTVASRLSKEFSVLLLEAGGDPLPQTYVPSNFAFINQHPSIMYTWNSIKQTHNALDDGGFSKVWQGRFLGGSSVINGLSYNRGNPKDYDNWANLTGDDSWSYKNVLKYFQMTEDFHEEKNEDGHLGVGGPLTIRKGGKELKSSYDAFINGAKELGYGEYVTSNGPQIEGLFGPISETIRFGRRCSVYDAFIKPILDRETLTILRYSIVSKVDIGENKVAVGVYYTQHGVESYAKAKFEVIVSAGTMNTPMVLLRSGIGPAEQLKDANIAVRANLPVGQQLQDHPLTLVCGEFKNPAKYPPTTLSQKDVKDYLTKGSGPLTLPWGIVGQGFVASSLAKSEGHPNWPDLELILCHNTTMFMPDADNNELKTCVEVVLGRVTSRGSISLDKNNIMNPGIWDPRWLEDERDVKAIAEGAMISASILDSHPFKAIGVSLMKNVNPNCKHEEFGTQAYWECYVRRLTKTTWHPVGTCKMGMENDKNAVVDTQLRVKGISGLRVIDNSIHPTITNANTNAPAIMIGQKGAHMILEHYERGEKKSSGTQDAGEESGRRKGNLPYHGKDELEAPEIVEKSLKGVIKSSLTDVGDGTSV